MSKRLSITSEYAQICIFAGMVLIAGLYLYFLDFYISISAVCFCYIVLTIYMGMTVYRNMTNYAGRAGNKHIGNDVTKTAQSIALLVLKFHPPCNF